MLDPLLGACSRTRQFRLGGGDFMVSLFQTLFVRMRCLGLNPELLLPLKTGGAQGLELLLKKLHLGSKRIFAHLELFFLFF